MPSNLIPLNEIKKHLAADSLNNYEAILELAQFGLDSLSNNVAILNEKIINVRWMEVVLNDLRKE